MKFSPGQRLQIPELAAKAALNGDTFHVDRLIEGGMGQCVRISQGDTVFALKLIRRDWLADQHLWARFLREARIWITVSCCEGVVEALCIARVNEIPVVCSTWMEGGSLRWNLRGCSIRTFYSAFSRIVGTLRWVYENAGVIHRDLKPDNILFDLAGDAYISDWGLARLRNAELPAHIGSGKVNDDPRLTSLGSILGTVGYASPEQLMGKAELDCRTDIYSLGCVMYELEAGRLPFDGASIEEVRRRHLHEKPAKLVGVWACSQFGAERVIEACLAKDPADRPGYEDLERMLASAAKDRGMVYRRYQPELRYPLVQVGQGEFRRRIRSPELGAWNAAGTNGLFEFEDMEPYIHEAETLLSLGEYRKAAEIYEAFFIPELVSALPDLDWLQAVTVNYGSNLISLGRFPEAMAVLQNLRGASPPPAGYYVNLALAQLQMKEYAEAARTATGGLNCYPGDPDLLGNLLIAQTKQEDFPAAIKTAQLRIARTRDVHSLQEVAQLHDRYAKSVEESDWPLAVEHYIEAVRLLREARVLNPRFLPVRLQLPLTLESMGAYGACSEEIKGAHELPLHFADRLALGWGRARCLDRTGAHRECWRYCDDWLKGAAQADRSDPLLRARFAAIERVRAVTVTDGFCVGWTRDGRRVVSPLVEEFFARIIEDEDLREEIDFCYLARLHDWAEEPERAFEILSRADGLYPDSWRLAFWRGHLTLSANDPRRAVEIAKRATRMAPWRPQCESLLSAGLRVIGDAEGAAAAASRADASTGGERTWLRA